ncbi:aminotransferase class IV [Methylocapsa sp. D3K7]|jgi:branched-chain amino acid aminotransferase|uniref:aminotransferase class IV n=1 Tax=Methylocapsa sp. D3K7 TaxID=3041435 RepID=UPI00244EF223|nr:aminotransferase class IV [Methylocapsa sp. D3K7]WGJ13366.1 aminotransferase class IV [Methylocapsa sp. D3K7]
MMRVWQDGRIIAPEDAHVAITDRGLLLGDGLFETMAVCRGKVCDLEAHLARLNAGLDILGFARSVDIPKLRADIAQYLAAEGAVSAVLRVTLTRGAGPRGLAPPEAPHPTILMTLSQMPPKREAPVSLRIATVTRRNEHSPLSRIKSLPYLDNVLALSEARAQGADDALMLNTRGAIACASAANLFIIRDGRLETPPIGDGALPGTIRALVLSMAKQAGLAPVETSLAISSLGAADHVFLTNSLSPLTEAGQCNGMPLQRRAGAARDKLCSMLMTHFEEG